MKPVIRGMVFKYGISSGLVAFLMWIYLSGRDFFGAPLLEKYRMLCDAFFIPGILFLMVACLVWASTKGAMDGISFLAQNFIRAIIPGARARTPQKYYDYLQERKDKRKKTASYRFLWIVGGFCMGLSIIFMILFYS